jgi:hypothetical protein
MRPGPPAIPRKGIRNPTRGCRQVASGSIESLVSRSDGLISSKTCRPDSLRRTQCARVWRQTGDMGRRQTVFHLCEIVLRLGKGGIGQTIARLRKEGRAIYSFASGKSAFHCRPPYSP